MLSSFLSAGYSTENAFFAATAELKSLLGEQALITKEFEQISSGLRLHKQVERLLSDLARRSGVDDIRNFTEVFRIAKRSGGELCGIIEHTTEVIRAKISVTGEIYNLTASRRFEQKIMNLMPFAIILYIDWSSEGFFDSMYGSLPGRLVMTGCLLAYLGACVLAGKILNIEV